MLPTINAANLPDKQRVVVLYHAHCPDGLAALAAADYHLTRTGYAVHSIPVSYGKDKNVPLPLPLDQIRAIKPTLVFVVDFSFSPGEVTKFCSNMAGAELQAVSIIDHHKTAIDQWIRADGMDAVVNVADFGQRLIFHRSNISVSFTYPNKDHEKVLAGSGLTWAMMSDEQSFINNNTLPYGLRLVNDRDLWQLTPEGDALHAFISAYRMQPDQYERFREMMIQATENDINTSVNIGTSLLDARNQIIAQAVGSSIKFGHMVGLVDDPIKAAIKHPVVWRYALIDVPYSLVSNAAEYTRQLCAKNGERIDFVAGWSTGTDGTVSLSLRSSDDSLADVTQIAGLFGGGGHRNASGASGVPLGTFCDHFLRHIERSIDAMGGRHQSSMVVVPNWTKFLDWARDNEREEAFMDINDSRCLEAQREYLEAFSSTTLRAQFAANSAK